MNAPPAPPIPRHARRPTAPTAWVGALAGAALAGSTAAGIFSTMHPRQGLPYLLEHLERPMWGGSFLLLLLIGGTLGWVGVRAAVRAPPGDRAGRSLSSMAKVMLGTFIGAALGVVTFLAFWVMHNPSAGFTEAAASIPDLLTDPRSPLAAFVLMGSILGLIGAVYLSRKPVGGGFAQRLAGGVLGAVAGTVIYSFAYLIYYHPGIPFGGGALFRFAEAMYSFSAVQFLFTTLAAVVGFTTARYSWRLYGVITLIALVTSVLGYLFYSLTATLPQLPQEALPLSLVLFAAETGSLSMVLLYSFYTLDVATRKQWRRAPRDAPFSEFYLPRVAIQVPMFNEPPELVLGTLRRLVALDYPEDRFLVMVADDSTDPESSGPVRAFCEAHGILYHRRPDRRGYKAGALNALLQHTPEDVDLIAVVDADYYVRPEYLRETVGFFFDARLGWVQTPQDYRNRHESFLTEQYYLADAYFYRTIMPSRNEENSIIFCGTMGILRKEALVGVGGWAEDFITEDAELSVRLVDAGWGSLYVNKTYGFGLIPATFETYKKQHYRWAFGGSKILRKRLGRMLFGRFTRRQRMDFIVGSLHWFEGVFILAIAAVLLALGIGEVLGMGLLVHHDKEILLVGLLPVFLLADGLTRLHMVLRKDLELSLAGTIKVLGMWMSVKFSNTFGALKALFGAELAFQRTQKAPDRRLTGWEAVRRAVRATPFETTMAGVFALVTFALGAQTYLHADTMHHVLVGRIVTMLWLAYYGLLFAAAPIYAYRSYTTLKTGRTPAPVPLPTPRGVPQ